MFTSLSLKIIATILMTIDHLGFIFPNTFPQEFRIIGRLAAPIFFFLLVESFYYTSNKTKYIQKLWFSAIAIYIGNAILFKYPLAGIATTLELSPILPNILLTLALNATVLVLLTNISTKSSYTAKANTIFKILILSLFICVSEYSLLSLFTILTFYYLRDKPKLRNIFFIILSLLSPYLTLSYIQSSMLLTVFILKEYNNKLSSKILYSNTLKAFFYLYYPIHLWILLTIAQALN